MDQNAKVLLDKLLAVRKNDRGGVPLPDDEAFELFCLEEILKSSDLSYEETLAGQIGGGDDGGVDGLFVFLDDLLVEEDSPIFEESFELRSVAKGAQIKLVAVQAKQSTSFTETAVQLLSNTVTSILDLSKEEDELAALLSTELIERVGIFRNTWEQLAPRHPTICVDIHYATKGDTRKLNKKVATRATDLTKAIIDEIPRSEARVTFEGARELLDLAAEEKSYTMPLPFKEMAAAPNSHVLLVKLQDYVDFISENGVMRKHIFDWNVRDFEGGVEVNKEITASLGDADAPEFWWLNNGVTVICSQVSITNKVCSLDDVQIVNGLQSSVSAFNYLSSAAADDPARERIILVRVIATQDPDTRDRIIRATNRQTAVQAASLRASDRIQRDLEAFFLSNEWYYERRKNYFRNQGKPAARTVTISYLAQAVLANGFSDPSNSRARPSSLLKNSEEYERIFDEGIPYPVYLWLAEVQKAVDGLLRSVKLGPRNETNFRFHTAMVAVARRYGGRVYNPRQLEGLIGEVPNEKEIASALRAVLDALEEYIKSPGRTLDKAVKSQAFTDFLLESVFPSDSETALSE
ncbi:MAG TPA: AIPR family protein [Solirubrobacterales bacterium]|nr:AIPR family protein [Solirubrobacterales bacterium]